MQHDAIETKYGERDEMDYTATPPPCNDSQRRSIEALCTIAWPGAAEKLGAPAGRSESLGDG
jgi:hypothetical protein